jgi:2'-deoxynucleoside 5'-phosphate N-hydrolase
MTARSINDRAVLCPSTMKIYFSCSLIGGRGDEAIYAAIVDDLLAHGHDVLSAHLARTGVMTLEQHVEPREIYQRDVYWVKDCHALVAEVSTPSHGVGYEIALALSLHKRVLCLYRQGARVSKMITGNDEPTLTVIDYPDKAGALDVVRRFVSA